MISDDSIFGKAGKPDATVAQVLAAVATHSMYEPGQVLTDAAADFAGIHPDGLRRAVDEGFLSVGHVSIAGGVVYRITAHVPAFEAEQWITGPGAEPLS